MPKSSLRHHHHSLKPTTPAACVTAAALTSVETNHSSAPISQFSAFSSSTKKNNTGCARQAAILFVYLFKNFGARHFVQALWQTGVQWAPTLEMFNNDLDGTYKHVDTHFASWTRRIACAVRLNKHKDSTKEAQQRSCENEKCGLTPQELQDRTNGGTATKFSTGASSTKGLKLPNAGGKSLEPVFIQLAMVLAGISK